MAPLISAIATVPSVPPLSLGSVPVCHLVAPVFLHFSKVNVLEPIPPQDDVYRLRHLVCFGLSVAGRKGRAGERRRLVNRRHEEIVGSARNPAG
jgi:hypothetical protein